MAKLHVEVVRANLLRPLRASWGPDEGPNPGPTDPTPPTVVDRVGAYVPPEPDPDLSLRSVKLPNARLGRYSMRALVDYDADRDDPHEEGASLGQVPLVAGFGDPHYTPDSGDSSNN